GPHHSPLIFLPLPGTFSVCAGTPRLLRPPPPLLRRRSRASSSPSPLARAGRGLGGTDRARRLSLTVADRARSARRGGAGGGGHGRRLSSLPSLSSPSGAPDLHLLHHPLPVDIPRAGGISFGPGRRAAHLAGARGSTSSAAAWPRNGGACHIRHDPGGQAPAPKLHLCGRCGVELLSHACRGAREERRAEHTLRGWRSSQARPAAELARAVRWRNRGNLSLTGSIRFGWVRPGLAASNAEAAVVKSRRSRAALPLLHRTGGAPDGHLSHIAGPPHAASNRGAAAFSSSLSLVAAVAEQAVKVTGGGGWLVGEARGGVGPRHHGG
ncbi:unnamed protein product, partial [Urochloa humidicola]